MKKLIIEFTDGTYTVVDNVTTYWRNSTSLRVRTLHGKYSGELMYHNTKVKSAFEVEGDDKRRII